MKNRRGCEGALTNHKGLSSNFRGFCMCVEFVAPDKLVISRGN